MTQKRLSSNQRMADAVLAGTGSTLEGFLSERFAKGYGYEQIAKELHSATDGAISVSYMTVKRWLADFGFLKAAS